MISTPTIEGQFTKLNVISSMLNYWSNLTVSVSNSKYSQGLSGSTMKKVPETQLKRRRDQTKNSHVKRI